MSTTRLKHVAQLNVRALSDSTSPDRIIRYLDIGAVGRGHLVDAPEEMSFGEAPSRARRLVAPGDTIVSTVRTYLRAVWRVPADFDPLVVSTGFCVLSPRLSVDPRYLGWWAESDDCVEEVVARSVGVSYPAVRPEDIGDVPFPFRELDEQRRIADFLDRETARIDALIAKRRSLSGLCGARRTALVDSVLLSVPRRGRLKHLLAQPPCYGVLKPDGFEGDDGVPLARITDVGDGEIKHGALIHISPEQDLEYRRTRVNPGDVVLSVVGTLGRSAVVRNRDAGLNLSRALARLVPNVGVDSGYIALWTESSMFMQEVDLVCQGSAQRVLNMGDLSNFPIPLPGTPSASRALVEAAHAKLDPLNRMQRRADQQIDLLRERRQALITHAVTGRLPIPA